MISLGPVASALDHAVDQPWAGHTQQVLGGPFTGPFWATTLPGGYGLWLKLPQGFVHMYKDVQTHNQEASQLQMGYHVSTPLHATHEEDRDFLPVFHHTSLPGICNC